MLDLIADFIFTQCLHNPKFESEMACHEAYVNCVVPTSGDPADSDFLFCVRALEKEGMRKPVYTEEARSAAGGSNE